MANETNKKPANNEGTEKREKNREELLKENVLLKGENDKLRAQNDELINAFNNLRELYNGTVNMFINFKRDKR